MRGPSQAVRLEHVGLACRLAKRAWGKVKAQRGCLTSAGPLLGALGAFFQFPQVPCAEVAATLPSAPAKDRSWQGTCLSARSQRTTSLVLEEKPRPMDCVARVPYASPTT